MGVDGVGEIVKKINDFYFFFFFFDKVIWGGE